MCVKHEADLNGEPMVTPDGTGYFELDISNMTCPEFLSCAPDGYCDPENDCDQHPSYYRVIMYHNN